MVERSLRMREARGSIPRTSTAFCVFFFSFLLKKTSAVVEHSNLEKKNVETRQDRRRQARLGRDPGVTPPYPSVQFHFTFGPNAWRFSSGFFMPQKACYELAKKPGFGEECAVQ